MTTAPERKHCPGTASAPGGPDRGDRLHGVLSLELAGHFTGMGFDPALLIADELA
ncbi:hypothetical protein JOD54_004033 [Actinokineospora baliensis]|nr:hypothetical protein [Actinokineospora baliensis]